MAVRALDGVCFTSSVHEAIRMMADWGLVSHVSLCGVTVLMCPLGSVGASVTTFGTTVTCGM